MVLEPLTYSRDEKGVKVEDTGYAAEEVPGLVIRVLQPSRWYNVTHAPSGTWALGYFYSLQDAARYLVKLGELCDWLEVEPGNELHERLQPVMEQFHRQLDADKNLVWRAENLEEARSLHGEATVEATRADTALNDALRDFYGWQAFGV